MTVRHLFSVLWGELKRIGEKPSRILAVANPNRIAVYLGYLRSRLSLKESWNSNTPGFARRQYEDYEEYLYHQTSSLRHMDLSRYDSQFRAALSKRLEGLNNLSPGMSVLCLGARLGTEVKAFLDVGCFGVGIDINPRPNSQYVVYGDFHKLQFSSESIDVVYTNSLDHAFDVEKILSEVKRVLKPTGLFIVEASLGRKHDIRPGFYESFWWEDSENLLRLIEQFHFQCIERSHFDIPWPGEQLCLKSVPA